MSNGSVINVDVHANGAEAKDADARLRPPSSSSTSSTPAKKKSQETVENNLNEDNELTIDEEVKVEPDDDRGRRTTRKKVTKTVRIIKRSTSRKRVKSRCLSDADLDSKMAAVKNGGKGLNSNSLFAREGISRTGGEENEMVAKNGRPIDRSQSMGKLTRPFLDPKDLEAEEEEMTVANRGSALVARPTNGGGGSGHVTRREEAVPLRKERLVDLVVERETASSTPSTTYQPLRGTISPPVPTLTTASSPSSPPPPPSSTTASLPNSLPNSPPANPNHDRNHNHDQDRPLELIVTHISRHRTRRHPWSFRTKTLTCAWTIGVDQVVRWSELVNDKNINIDGVSRLRVHKDRFSFESYVYEL